MKPQIIVCGLGQTGYQIFNLLRRQGASVVGISDRPILGEHPDHLVVGELRSPAILAKAGIHHAHTLVLASNDDAVNLGVLTQARLLNPHIRIINRLFNHTLGERLDQTLPQHVSMSVASLAAPIFSFAALGNKAIGQLKLFRQTWPIQEIIIDENHPWLGLNLSQLWDDPSRMLIYYLPAHGELDLVSAVLENKSLQLGDHLILGTKPTIRSKRSYPWQKVSKAIANLRRYQRYVRPVFVVTISLLLTIFMATMTYVAVNYNISVVDSFYFSVGMITGAGGQEQVAEKAPDVIKIFTAIMMIVGAGVIGVYYALLNDFILGSRLKQFWDAARVPIRHHYIVCGLGGIGIQIVRQLLHQGHEVVVIESDANNRFLHTARSLGVPVIVEDARMADTLTTANIEQAAAILVVTSNDMINVEIGLTAKAISPKLSIVLRSHDAQFALSVQEVFEFENVLCPAELATPSFAAAALGGRILGNGITEDLLWVALATLITTNHPLCQKSVKEAAMETNFVPLYLERKEQTIHSWNLLESYLLPNDILYLTIPANELDRLWRTSSDDLIFNETSMI
ncbi:TrkA-N domain protein [Rippkaea orientalis PCC 8801]|uniref:TrkA-N domain protein n=1 Tax=Rippkaea orientalis (strain PCC 8801 / RF-1) TaxID=41431 RepID=B7K5R1_RIPO1|nr:NAD-binding protein [Rippkaea orientalis]ACK66794.1 TrkA-N domain protein [Rippkaea orientalis PCC 8801]